MCDDFDLLDALPSSDKDDRAEPEQPSACEMKILYAHDKVFDRLPQVVDVVMLLYRLKGKLRNQEFALETLSDDRLCGQCKVTIQEKNLAGTFKPCGRKVECSLSDYNKKTLVRKNSQVLHLQATHLRENMDYKKVTFHLDKYVNPRARGYEAVVLTIAGSNNVLSCTRPPGSDSPVLMLEDLKYEQLESIEAKGEEARFLFYRKNVAFSNTTFESVRYTGWFIRSSSIEHKPVEMCEKDSTTNLFMFEEHRVNT